MQEYAHATGQTLEQAQAEISKIGATKGAWEASSFGQTVQNVAAQHFDGNTDRAFQALTIMAPAETAAKYARFGAMDSTLGHLFNGNYEEFAKWEKEGSVLTKPMAEKLTSEGYGAFFAGESLKFNIGQDRKAIVSAESKDIDGNVVGLPAGTKATVNTTGAGAEIKWQDKDGFKNTWAKDIVRDQSGMAVKDENGNIMYKTSTNVGERTYTPDDSLDLGKGIRVIGGEVTRKGGELKSAMGGVLISDHGKEYHGTISQDAKTGKTVLISEEAGKDKRTVDIDDKTFERLDTVKTGRRIETGSSKIKLDVDTTKVERGTSVRGVDGATYWDADTALNIAKDFSGSLRTARSFFTGNETVNDTNVVNYTNSFAAEFRKWSARVIGKLILEAIHLQPLSKGILELVRR